MKNRPFLFRLSFAASGILAAWKQERSFRVQVILGTGAALVTAIVGPGLVWAAIVSLAIALVLAIELLNSALEVLIDHIHPEIAPAIKRAKDIAAGAVLVTTIGAVVVGGLMIIITLGR